jgi:general L-amino acid transport system substrate-binding protein
LRGLKFLPLLLVLLLGLAACNGNDDAAAPEPDLPDIDDNDDVELDDEDVAQVDEPTDGTLDAVRQRGLVCGVNDAVPGFGFLTPEGEYEGFDVDFCRALAAAVTGDPDNVEFVALTAEARFTALQAREIDVLIRNTTWTASRDGGESASFAVTTFYDGQGMMVSADSPFNELEDMDNTAVCVLSGTTTELNLESQFLARGIPYEPLTFEDNDTLREAFLAERCDGWTSDKSQLAAFRAEWPEEEGGPEALRILDVTMSKEPLGPATLDGDTEWFDVVNWMTIATIQAEEFEITQENLDQVIADTDPEDNPEVARFLGLDGFDPGLGLDPEWVQDVIRAVGNYGEIYNRNVGPETALGLERGLNALWTDGGLLYPPPYR